MNTFETKKIDQEPLDCFKVEPTTYYDENNNKIDEKEFKEKYWREDYKNTFSDNVFYWIITIWIIFFIYFIISFFLPKSINIEEARLDIYNRQQEIRLEQKDIILKAKKIYDIATECGEANSETGTLADCNLLNKD